MSWEAVLEGKVLLPRKGNWGQVGSLPQPCVGAVAPHQLCWLSPPGSYMGSRRPVAAKAKPLLQLVRASWVCVSVAVLPLPSPILRFILLWWIVALFLTHTVQLPAWEVGTNLTLWWLVPYKGKCRAYLQNKAHVDDVSVAKLCPLPSHPCCITEREERSQSKWCNC